MDCAAVAKLDLKGVTDGRAASFVASTPASQPGPGYSWVGQRLYLHGYQTSCRASGTTLVCAPADTWLTRLAHR